MQNLLYHIINYEKMKNKIFTLRKPLFNHHFIVLILYNPTRVLQGDIETLEKLIVHYYHKRNP